VKTEYTYDKTSRPLIEPTVERRGRETEGRGCGVFTQAHISSSFILYAVHNKTTTNTLPSARRQPRSSSLDMPRDHILLFKEIIHESLVISLSVQIYRQQRCLVSFIPPKYDDVHDLGPSFMTCERDNKINLSLITSQIQTTSALVL